LGYISLKPLGAALAKDSSSLAAYEANAAQCLKTVHALPERGRVIEIVAGVGAAVVFGGAIVGVVVMSTGGGAAAAAAAALLAKYGLEFRKGPSRLEVNIEKMCSEEMIQVQDAPDLSLQECVEFVIATSFHPEEEEENNMQALTSLRIKTQQSVRKVRSQILQRKKSTRKSFRKKRSIRILHAAPLVENDIRILRDKAERSHNWSLDPDRTQIKNMTVDEAAAIMLYTQECCMYRRLNAALRAHDTVELGPYLPFMKLLLTALYKLPLVNAKVYRGVKLNLAEVYNALSGKWFSWWSFSSTTLDLKVLQSPLFLGKQGDRTLFCIEALGVDIAAFSAMPNESEVLMLPGMRLSVMDGIHVEEDMWKFNVFVSKNAAPVIDFSHPGCQEYNMTLAPMDAPLPYNDARRNDARRGERRTSRDEENVSDARRTAVKPKKVDGSNWPSIPGCGPDKV